MSDCFLRTEGLTKKFGPFYALKDLDFSINRGEIRGLVGENGAGKSTLIKILTGVYQRTSGKIYVNGIERSLQSPVESRRCGISVVHQERNIVPTLSVLENLFLGEKLPRRVLAVDFRSMERKARQCMEEYGIDLPLSSLGMDLSPSESSMLEILQAVMIRSSLLILDEPTASLSEEAAEKLFALIKRLNAEGTAILYVSHRLDEIFTLAGSITVLRNGCLIDTVQTDAVDKTKLVYMMSGELEGRDGVRQISFGRPLLSASHLKSADGKVKDVSVEVRKGEILGIFGLDGSGRTETLETIYGLRDLSGGSIMVGDMEYTKPSPAESIRKGLSLIHEDRLRCSLVKTRSVKDNIVLSVIDKYKNGLFYDSKKESEDVIRMMQLLDIRARSLEQMIAELSGGNQQKAVFAKAMISSPDVMLCDEPTQAVDVKTRHEIHSILREYASFGHGVVLVSSDLEEILEVADTIEIISCGRSLGFMENKALTAPDILRLCYKED